MKYTPSTVYVFKQIAKYKYATKLLLSLSDQENKA